MQLTPLNIDTLCHDGKSKTIINKIQNKKPQELTDEERMERQVSLSIFFYNLC